MAKKRPAKPRNKPGKKSRKADLPAAIEEAVSDDSFSSLAVESSDGEPPQLASPPWPIVAVGASAGGLEAFSQLLFGMPSDPGLTIVLVQHLAPHNASLLPELLRAHARLPVVQVTDGMPVETDRVYVIPPGVIMTLHDGRFRLEPRPDGHGHNTPIDTFFCSVAEQVGNRSIGVILSGTATDGAVGIKAIKAAGGIAFAQEPTSAKFDGMPRAAIATEMVDLVLPPAEITDELVRIASHPYVHRGAAPASGNELPVDDEKLRPIFQMLRSLSGVDFTQYKQPTIKRRLHRRMALHKIASIEHYVKYLEENPGEVQSLYHDLLIHVTRFFREVESFETLQNFVFPKIVSSRKSEVPIRIWIPGCSTGEEPYSVAMALLEYLGDDGISTPIQIFATDLSEIAIERARAGLYPESVAADVSSERLRRFFARSDGHYQVNRSVRDLCIFARQDLTRDPPFSKLNLIVCRNVLIYLGTALQKKLMRTFHYALKAEGFLMLGQAETVGMHADLFAVAEKKHRVYVKKAIDVPQIAALQADYHMPRIDVSRRLPREPRASTTFLGEVDRLLLDQFTPPGVIIDSNLQIVQFRGQTGPYLEPASGDPSLDLLKMARDGLVHGLRTAIRAARKSDGPVRRDGLRVVINGQGVDVDIEVVPIGPAPEDRYYLILFCERSHRDPAPTRPAEKGAKVKSQGKDHQGELLRIRQELAASREYLQSIIPDLEAANEELQSANEEILSSNEELQSTNEELDTAKEELQSTNEELNTLNEELHGRNEELSRVNSDLINLLGSVQIAIVMVSGDLRIRRFTPMAEKILNLIPADIGRPIGHIKPNIDCPDIELLISEVVDSMTVVDREVRDRQGHWHSLRIRPYKNVENRIDGAVLSLFDIHASKRQKEEFIEARDLADAVLDVVPSPAMLIDGNLKVRRVNSAFHGTFGTSADEWSDRPLQSFQFGAWQIEELRTMLQRVQAGESSLEEQAITHDFPRLGRATVSCTVRPLVPGKMQQPFFLLTLQLG